MKALISPNETFDHKWISSWVQNNDTQVFEPSYSEIIGCQRVAQVATEPFDVAQPLFWVDCSDDCKADFWYYKDGVCYVKQHNEPDPNPPPDVEDNEQPESGE